MKKSLPVRDIHELSSTGK